MEAQIQLYDLLIWQCLLDVYILGSIVLVWFF